MSFILEALRRAESERERAALPGLHARPVPLPDGGGPRTTDTGRLGWVVAGLSLAALVGVLGWQGREKPAAPAEVGPASAGRVVLAPPSAPAARASTPVSGASLPSGVAPAAVAALLPAPPVRRAEAPALPRAAAAAEGERRAAPPKAVPAVAASAALPAVVVAPASTAVAASAAAPRLAGVAELPAAVRATLPALAIGGLVYSDTPARRFVVINGQIYHEGGEPAAGVVVEQIKPKGAVLRYQGHRYEVGY